MQPKTLKDISRTQVISNHTGEHGACTICLSSDLKQLIISHIKHMRREGRDYYYSNIDEKSAIPKLMEIFNLTEEDVGKERISKVDKFL